MLKSLVMLLVALAAASTGKTKEVLYSPRGVGGGGALAGYSISPYGDLRFVGTDMGTLFRSTDRGNQWTPVNQTQVTYNSDLTFATEVGFSSDPKVLFFADAGRDPKRSRDGGVTWTPIPILLQAEERISYWVSDPKDPQLMLCGTTKSLLRSFDQGRSWTRVEGMSGKSRGTVLSGDGEKRMIFHATESAIFIAEKKALHFRKWFTPPASGIRAFTGGSDCRGQTLAYIDSQAKEACTWAAPRECGWVWVHQGPEGEPHFKNTRKAGGRFIRMAENDSQTIYVTGGDWIRQYGSKIWVSRDAGKTWNLRLNLLDWDSRPYRPWPKDRLEYSAVGLDTGWNDNAPLSFAVNSRNSSEAGVTGHYFLHITDDSGEHWRAPFTQFADSGIPAPKKRWKSTGLEVASVLRLKFHPRNSKLGYASVADLGGMITEDGGLTWRISKAKYNTNYDYAFDPAKPDSVFSASGDQHDFPLNKNTPIKSEGGIFSSEDRGIHWRRLTPTSGPYNRQFLSVAYDPGRRLLYGGTQGGGVARSRDAGKTWEFHNSGIPEGERVIPQLEIDPGNGTVYALITGNAPEYKNAAATGIYRLNHGPNSRWELLRGTVHSPKDVDRKHKLWLFPSAFAIDFTRPNRDVLWLSDLENSGAWLATGIWKSTDSGRNWNRMTQFTHPTAITLDPKEPQKVYASGLFDVAGNWGLGGALTTTDGGKSWKKNQHLPLLANLFGFTPDPIHSENGFYLFFGGGIFYGPKAP